MALSKELGWTEALERQASKVRNRWNKLRKAYQPSKKKTGILAKERRGTCGSK
jgi:hypothetical protein